MTQDGLFDYPDTTIKELLRQRTDRVMIEIVFAHIEQAASPFRITQGYVEIKPTYPELVLVTVDNWPFFRFEFALDNLLDIDRADSIRAARALGQAAASYFRNIPRVEPDSNVILGEN